MKLILEQLGYESAADEIWRQIKFDIILVKLKYDTVLNNSKLSEESVKIFLNGKKDKQFKKFDKVELILKDGKGKR